MSKTRILGALSVVVTAAALLTVTAASAASAQQSAAATVHRPAPPDVIHTRGTDVFPHSVDYDPRTQTFVVGSLKHNTISVARQDGTVRTLVDDPDLVSAQAIRVDPDRHRVLTSNVDYGLAERSNKTDPFRVAGVGAYDLESGQRLWYADLSDGDQHLISDVTVAPDGTAYAIDQLTPTVFRIDRHGRASVLLTSDLLAGTVNIPGFLSGIGMTAVTWLPGDILIIAKADGSLVRVPVCQPTQARAVRLAISLAALTAGIRALPDGSLAVVSSGLLTGEPAKIQRVRPEPDWSAATVSVTDTVGDPVTSGITAGPARSTYALSGDLASLLAGKPGSGFTLTRVSVN
jgi:hypothetical protein